MARNSAQNRRLDVLRAIVTQYVATREPVGSKAIAAGGLGVSSATIRNDMAVLEEAGLIYQPHTSAGRVPTDRGYRVFVDRLAQIKPMTTPERQALETFLSDSVDIDDVVERSVRLLAQVTHQVALVQYPGSRVRTLKHLEVLGLTPGRVLLMRLFSEADPSEELHVSIGAENPHDALAEAAVVTGTYRAGADDTGGSAHLGIVGPMRMDYARTMSSVRAVAAYLSRYLAQETNN